MSAIDQARPIDSHAALPTHRLKPWLEETLGQSIERLELGRFGGGWSNLTFLLSADGRQLVLRRPPPGVTIRGAHDMAREHRIVSGVGKVWSKVPRTIAVCEDPGVLGGSFYVMERIEGVILRGRVPPGLDLSEGVMASASRALVDTLVEIHRLDIAAAGLEGLGQPEGYVERQVSGWTRRYDRARTDDIAAMTEVAAWLEATRPAEAGVSIIHNDYKYDNVLLDPADLGSVLAVLDWEMATIGCPMMDLGTALAWWVDSDDPPELQVLRLGQTHLPGNLKRRQVADRYLAASGRTDDPTWYYVFGLFKNAVVAQQLYARWKAGHTTEARYQMMLGGVIALSTVALRAAQRGRIDALEHQAG